MGEAALSRPRELCWLVLGVEGIEARTVREEEEADREEEF